jgi:hypothetical protein
LFHRLLPLAWDQSQWPYFLRPCGAELRFLVYWQRWLTSRNRHGRDFRPDRQCNPGRDGRSYRQLSGRFLIASGAIDTTADEKAPHGVGPCGAFSQQPSDRGWLLLHHLSRHIGTRYHTQTHGRVTRITILSFVRLARWGGGRLRPLVSIHLQLPFGAAPFCPVSIIRRRLPPHSENRDRTARHIDERSTEG